MGSRFYLRFYIFIFGIYLTQTSRVDKVDPIGDKLSGLFELLGFSTSCASATLTACRNDCPHDFNDVVWKAKQSVDSAAIELSHALVHLANAMTCLPPRNPVQDGKLTIVNQIRAEKLVSTPTTTKKPPANFYPRDCVEVRDSGYQESGVYDIYPNDAHPTDSEMVYCDQKTDGGGWVVIQRRENQHPREIFNRDWSEYTYGFGNLSGEFWLGLELIRLLSKNTSTQLRIDLEDAQGKKRYAIYNKFNLGNLTSKYRINIGEYTGDAGDSMSFHNNQKFTTFDQDNDSHRRLNCAQQNNGGWWFNSCLHSNLNGYPYIGKAKHAKGIIWFTWHGYSYSLTKVSMKIRPISTTMDQDNQPSGIPS